MRYCHYCGHVVPDDARFCPSCGKDLTLSAVKQPETATPQQTNRPTFTISGNPIEPAKPVRQRTQTPKAPVRKPETDANSEPEKKQSSLWGCTVAVLIVALLAGGILFTYNQLFDRSHYNNILAPKDDVQEEEQLPITEQEATKEPPKTVEEHPKEVHREPVIIEEEPEAEVEEPEELPAEEENQLEQLIKNHSQED